MFDLEASYDDHGQGGAYWDTSIKVTKDGKLMSEVPLNRIGAMYSVNSRETSEALYDLIVVEFDLFNVGAYTVSSKGELQELVNIETKGSDNRCYGLLDIDNDQQLELVFNADDVDYWESVVHGQLMREKEEARDPEHSLLVFELLGNSEDPIRIFGVTERE